MENSTAVQVASNGTFVVISGTYDLLWKIRLLYIPSVILAVAGIPGALVTIRFFGRQIKKSTTATSLFLTSIAVFDLFTLIFILPIIGFSMSRFYFYNMKSHIYLVLTFIVRLFKHCSNLALALTAVERLFSVAFPHKVKNIFTKRVGIICLVFVCVFANVSILPMLLRFNEKQYEKNMYTIFYRLSIFTYFFFSLGCVVFCNVGLVVLLLHRAKSKRSNSNIPITSQARELRMTKLVIVVTTIFIVCTLPLVVLFPLENAGVVNISRKTLMMINPFSILLETINYSMNALVYFIGNKTFREEVSSICKYLRKRRVDPVDSRT